MSGRKRRNRKAADRLVALDSDALLRRYAPVLQYDSQAAYRAVAVESITTNPGNKLMRRKDEIASVTGVQRLALTSLADNDRGSKRERLKQASERLEDARRFQGDPRHRDRVYGRSCVHAGRMYLQYWLWFYYVPSNLHRLEDGTEGAWRAIHVELGSDGQPTNVILDGVRPSTRRWADVHKRHGRPVVCISPFRNDLLFEPGTQNYLFFGPQQCDRNGVRVQSVFTDFGSWVDWPGRWGSSAGSPRSPSTFARWKKPGYPLRSRVRAAIARGLSRLGSGSSAPPMPEAQGRLERERVVVHYSFPNAKPARLAVTVHDRGQVVGAARVDNPRRKGEHAVAVPPGLGRCTLKVAALTSNGRRSPVASKALIANEPDQLEQAILESVAADVLEGSEVREFARQLRVKPATLKRFDEKAVWKAVGTELQAFRDARTDQARWSRASHELGSASRWMWLWIAVSLLLVTASAAAALVDPEVLWFWAAVWYVPVGLLGGIFQQWDRRRKESATKEEAASTLRGDLDGSAARASFERALREKGVAPAIRQKLNEAATALYDAPLRFGDEGLKELRVTDREIATAATNRLAETMRRMPDGSIGIAGPRGAGKSTLMRMFAKHRDANDRRLTAVVDAPVRYEARDFVLTLLVELCQKVLREDRSVTRQRGFVERVGLARLGCAVLALGIATGLEIVVASEDLKLGLTAGLAVAAMALPALAIWFLIIPRLKPQPPQLDEAGRLARRAAALKHEARYLQSYSEGYSGKLALPVGPLQAETSKSKTKSFDEQQRSFPEIVGMLREFVADAARVRGGVLIGIDEMDKMESPEAAQQFLNEIKGVFGIDGCFYLVSISENAMSAFERRGLPFRDVFDSSFDEVVHVSPLPLAQSRELLEGRVIGLGPPFIDLCHVMSGGLARDLLRMVRQLSLLNERPVDERGIARVCEALVGHELAVKVKASVVEAQRCGAREPELSALLRWMRGLPVASPRAAELVERATAAGFKWPPDGASDGAEALGRLHGELLGFAYFLATVLELFSSCSGSAETYFKAAEDGMDIDGGRSDVDALARARAAFEVNPRVAVGLVREFRAARGWSVIPEPFAHAPAEEGAGSNGGSPAEQPAAPSSA